MVQRSKLELMKDFFTEVWENGNYEYAEKSISGEFRMEGMGENTTFPVENMRDLIEAYRVIAGTPSIEITHHIADGDWIATRFLATSAGPDGATPMEVSGMMMTRFDGELILENFTKLEYLQAFEQIGRIPQDSLAMLISGQSLVLA